MASLQSSMPRRLHIAAPAACLRSMPPKLHTSMAPCLYACSAPSDLQTSRPPDLQTSIPLYLHVATPAYLQKNAAGGVSDAENSVGIGRVGQYGKLSTSSSKHSCWPLLAVCYEVGSLGRTGTSRDGKSRVNNNRVSKPPHRGDRPLPTLSFFRYRCLLGEN